ncbi:cupin domain-containing protein [Granulicella mallensis]|uniref:Cupin 2 conserved barrel domain protein n=1 Tax=Granulicella mallensis (strain ATCC BAA-1857 / DSM 23137 / MP5ACTX8) TaxID=682795 RepID=G8NUT6_GRAMM|nr:cupin domain-containing protein [Granulicella mallensis]AEU37626.1 Cupin 2 conserved barrel domain protein [Granulicella mallensis MP5ACTX8]
MSSSTAHHTSWAELPVEQLDSLVTRQFVTGSQVMLARLELKKGSTGPRHVHPNEQISYLAVGAMRFSIGEEGSAEERIFRAGDVLVIPGNLPHTAEAIEDSVIFDIFAPPRTEWLGRNNG